MSLLQRIMEKNNIIQNKKSARTYDFSNIDISQPTNSLLKDYYNVLLSDSPALVNQAAEKIAEIIKSFDVYRIMKLDEEFRDCTSMEWFCDWKTVDLKLIEKKIVNHENYLWVIRLGTMHPNGFFREKCVNELIENKESIVFLLLRLNDWAKPIRVSAENSLGLIPELGMSELTNCIPVVNKIRKGGRRNSQIIDSLESIIPKLIKERYGTENISDITKYDYRLKKIIYRLLMNSNMISKQDVEKILAKEKNSQCSNLLMTMSLNKNKYSIAELDKFMLNFKSYIVVRLAIEHKYKILGDAWDGLEKMLLNKNISVRGLSAFILNKKTDLDIVSYYLKYIDTDYRKICVLGIGENGSEKDADYLIKYLEDDNQTVVKNTLHGISLLLGFKASDVFLKYLQDKREVVSRQAYREIVANNISFGAKNVYEIFINNQSEYLRELLANQFRRENTWKRLPYLLKLYNYPNEIIKNTVIELIEDRNMYANIPKDLADEIRMILDDTKYNIPEKIKEKIIFDLKYVER